MADKVKKATSMAGKPCHWPDDVVEIHGVDEVFIPVPPSRPDPDEFLGILPPFKGDAIGVAPHDPKVFPHFIESIVVPWLELCQVLEGFVRRVAILVVKLDD